MDRRAVSRRELFGLGVGATVGIILAPSAEAKMEEQRPAPLDPELVKAFVGAAHGDLEKVKSMLKDQPGLLNATWDWGGGDFESAIGGAGHMGRRDIAEYLIAQGARTDVFVAAMLGQLEVVKAAIAADPSVVRCKGPHGIPLRRHAEMGKDGAKNVLDYLDSLKA